MKNILKIFLLTLMIHTQYNGQEFEANVKWEYPSSAHIRDLVVTDLNADNIKDIIFCRTLWDGTDEFSVVALDGNTGEMIWQNLRSTISDIELIDYNNDLIYDIIALDWNNVISVLNGIDGSILIESLLRSSENVKMDKISSDIAAASGNDGLKVVDIDLDGRKEIVTRIENRVAVLDKNMNQQWLSQELIDWPSFTIGNIDLDNQLEIVYVAKYIKDNESAKFFAYDFVNSENTLLFESEISNAGGTILRQDISIDDFDSTMVGNEIVMMNGISTNNNSRIDIIIENITQGYTNSFSSYMNPNNSDFTKGDINNDNVYEMILYGSDIELYAGNGTLIWNNNQYGEVAFITDLNGDYKKELIIEDRIYDAQNGTYIQSLPRDSNPMGGVLLIAQTDIDDDDNIDLITGHHPDTGIKLYEFNNPNVLKVTSPNGGETFAYNTNFLTEVFVEWNKGNANFIDIEFCDDYSTGPTWRTIATNVNANQDWFSWSTPGINSSDCKVKITNSNDSTDFDESDDVFTIYISQAEWESEPNDSAVVANEVALGDTILAFITPNDRDYFKLYTEAGDTIEIYAEDREDSNLLGMILVYDKDGNYVGGNEMFSDEYNNRVIFIAEYPDYYYVRYSYRYDYDSFPNKINNHYSSGNKFNEKSIAPSADYGAYLITFNLFHNQNPLILDINSYNVDYNGISFSTKSFSNGSQTDIYIEYGQNDVTENSYYLGSFNYLNQYEELRTEQQIVLSNVNSIYYRSKAVNAVGISYSETKFLEIPQTPEKWTHLISGGRSWAINYTVAS